MKLIKNSSALTRGPQGFFFYEHLLPTLSLSVSPSWILGNSSSLSGMALTCNIIDFPCVFLWFLRRHGPFFEVRKQPSSTPAPSVSRSDLSVSRLKKPRRNQFFFVPTRFTFCFNMHHDFSRFFWSCRTIFDDVHVFREALKNIKKDSQN